MPEQFSEFPNTDPLELVRDIDTGKRIRERLNIPLDFYEHPEKITDLEVRRIVEYRGSVGAKVMEMYESIRADQESQGRKFNPWDVESVLDFDDFVAKGDYLKQKLQESALLQHDQETSDIAEYYFSPKGATESLYELMIAKKLVPLAVEGNYLEDEDVENAFKLIPPSSDTLSDIFLKRLQVEQRTAAKYFKDRFDVEKRKKLWNLLETGFCVSKGLVRSGVREIFTHADILTLTNEIAPGAQVKVALDEYFQAVLERRDLTREDVPTFLRERANGKLSVSETLETDRNPRRDITHSYLTNRVKTYLDV